MSKLNIFLTVLAGVTGGLKNKSIGAGVVNAAIFGGFLKTYEVIEKKIYKD